VIISLVGIGSGFIVLFGLLNGKRLDGWTCDLPHHHGTHQLDRISVSVRGLKPSYVLGALSLVVLAIAIFARYARRTAGAWRGIYVVTAALALYFNCFVAVVQSFLKIPALHAMAPTGSEPPFLVAQCIVLAVFIWLTWLAAKRFHVEAVRST
jgi:hypothetical protein